MKAKDLIKILEKYPEHEVQYDDTTLDEIDVDESEIFITEHCIILGVIQ